ncbi:MAG TPA: hypothetical protein VM143_16895 [Acidimicrobiales bacterium]|nr:hypothetical protein [Acidimicrobiales bacterium]
MLSGGCGGRGGAGEVWGGWTRDVYGPVAQSVIDLGSATGVFACGLPARGKHIERTGDELTWSCR